MHSNKLNRFFLWSIVSLALIALGLGSYLSWTISQREPESAQTPVEERTPLPTKASRVVIVSWDGAKPVVMKSLIDEGKLPTFASLQVGSYVDFDAQTVVPSVTLPSHTSMLTGRPISEHKITWNDYQPERGFVKSETVFELAKKQGIGTAMVATKEKFAHLNKPETIDHYFYERGDAATATNRALEILEDTSVGLLFLHFKEPDAAGHAYGWGGGSKDEAPSQQYMAALQEVDRVTGLLLAQLKSDESWDQTVVIITSDHGGKGKSHGSDSPEDTTIPWAATGGKIQQKYQFASSALSGRLISTMDTAATALSLLEIPVPTDWTGKNLLSKIEIPLGTPIR